MGPGFRVVSREVSEEFGGCFMAEASQARAIVVVDEGLDKGVALGVMVEAIFAGVAGGPGMSCEGVAEAAIEALGHAIGLRPIGAGEFVSHCVGVADLVEGVGAGAAVTPAPAHVAEAVGELRPVIGEDGVDGMAERGEEALQARGDGGAPAIVDDFDMDEAGGAFDGDEDVGGVALQAGEVLQVDVDITERLRGEVLGCRLRLGRRLRHAAALQAAVQGGAGDIGTQAAAHDLKVRNSTAISSSSVEKPVAGVWGTDERSATSRRCCQRRTVVSLIPSSRASAAAGWRLAWM